MGFLEIHEYAKYLGMDPKKDKDYLYIAKEGLKAPLPEKWKPYKNRKGDIYYINVETKQIVYEHPCDEYYRRLFKNTKKKEKVVIKPNSLNNKSSTIISAKNKQETSQNSSFVEENQFTLLNDSFSENTLKTNSVKFSEKSQSDMDFTGNSEREMNEVDLNVNSMVLDYKLKKQKEFDQENINFEKEVLKKKGELETNLEKNVDLLKKKLALLQEKMKKEMEKVENGLRLQFKLKLEEKIKEEKEKFEDLKQIQKTKLNDKRQEKLEAFEEKLKNEINEKKSKIFLLKQEFDKQMIFKKKFIEKKKKFLLEKIKEKEIPELEHEFRESLSAFQTEENEKSQKKIKEFLVNLDNECRDSLHVHY